MWNEDGLDIFAVAPTDERPFLTLITAGLSDTNRWTRPRTSGSWPSCAFCCPPRGRLNAQEWDESQQWTLLWLKYLAQMPREIGRLAGLRSHHSQRRAAAALGRFDRSRQRDADSAGFVARKICASARRMKPMPKASSISGRLIPLLPDELRMKMQAKTPTLLEKMEKAKLSDILDPGRRSVLASRGLKKFFLG